MFLSAALVIVDSLSNLHGRYDSYTQLREFPTFVDLLVEVVEEDQVELCQLKLVELVLHELLHDPSC